MNGTALSFSSYTVSYDKVVACCACNLDGAGRDRDNGQDYVKEVEDVAQRGKIASMCRVYVDEGRYEV